MTPALSNKGIEQSLLHTVGLHDPPRNTDAGNIAAVKIRQGTPI